MTATYRPDNSDYDFTRELEALIASQKLVSVWLSSGVKLVDCRVVAHDEKTIVFTSLFQGRTTRSIKFKDHIMSIDVEP